MNWTIFLFGLLAGALAGMIGAICLGIWLLLKLARNADQAAASAEADTGDPVEDLAALAVEILKRTGRSHWDVPTVYIMACWLQAHAYTPLSDPAEIVPVFLREC